MSLHARQSNLGCAPSFLQGTRTCIDVNILNQTQMFVMELQNTYGTFVCDMLSCPKPFNVNPIMNDFSLNDF